MSQRSLSGFGMALALFAAGNLPLAAQPTRSANQTPPAQMPAVQPVAAQTNAPAVASADAFKPQDSHDPEPAFGPESLERTRGALKFYEDIVSRGGWKKLADGARGLKQGGEGAHVRALKERLAISGDLDNGSATSDRFDAATATALKRFQSRHGLTETGALGRLTFAAINVSAEVRLKQLHATVDRLQNNVFKFEKRYVVVNIPGAVVEAVNHGRVERRHLAVVGKKERQSPVISARISSVNVNPHWTVPNSIIKNDVAKALRKDLTYLNKHNLRTLNFKGEEIDPNAVNWSFKSTPNFLLRQDPGPQNSLGQLKIDMPNTEAVYMHDTPKKELFKQDVRFHSSGCARVSDVRDLAAWLVADQGVTRADLDREIEAGSRTEIKLKKHVPVAWVYLTAYGDGQGQVQFREDIYGLDTPEGVALTTLDGKKKVRPKAEDAIPVAQAKPRKANQSQVAQNKPPQIDSTVTGSLPARSSSPRSAVAPQAAQRAKAMPKPLTARTVALVEAPVPPRAIPVAVRN